MKKYYVPKEKNIECDLVYVKIDTAQNRVYYVYSGNNGSIVSYPIYEGSEEWLEDRDKYKEILPEEAALMI